jgi:hypothetical protein
VSPPDIEFFIIALTGSFGYLNNKCKVLGNEFSIEHDVPKPFRTSPSEIED